MRSVLHSLIKSVALPGLFSTLLLTARAETNPRQYAVEVSAAVQTAPARITLTWAPDASATGYTIHRKALHGTSWMQLANLGNVNSWSDLAVANGNSYEYSVLKTTSAGYQGTGYIYAGLNAPMTEARGKMVLIVDNTHAAALAPELERLRQDLVGDGWTVIRHDVARTASPVTIKNLIKADYYADPANVKSVFLFGHVPVPYSGNFTPDGHPDHQGAWVADTYYGDMDGIWTDATVNNGSAHKPWNRNVPGDGKFDQSSLPSDVELQVGRVDLSNLTCYANKTPARSELDLLRAYLNKHHAFRHGQIQLNRRGLVCDNFGERDGEAFAATGWRTFAPLFGGDNHVQAPYGTYFTTLKDQAYLWSYGTGGGSWYTCNGVGGSDDFALTDIKSVFTTYLGSYFGDWDNESNFLRASLGSGYVLATAWGGRPHWFFHHMGLGETIGHSAKINQNNSYGGLYAAQNYGTRNVHVTLLGDPALRLHPVLPPSNVSARSGSGVTVSWSPSTDANLQGYVVYRAASVQGPFTRVSGSGFVAGTSFLDANGAAGQVYMVRAVKLEQSGSGTYYNPSQGIFATADAGEPNPPEPAPPSSFATFVSDDWNTRGNWQTKYGSDGHMIALNTTQLPAYASVSKSGDKTWAWAQISPLPSALQTASGSARTATCWYSAAAINVSLNFTDGQTHRVAFYMWDAGDADRRQTIEVLNQAGQVVSSRSYANFDNGVYANFDVKGQVTLRFKNDAAVWNSVISGIFFGSSGVAPQPAPAPSPAPTTPSSGAPVRFLGTDTALRGSWKGALGTLGSQIITESAALPAFAAVSPSGKADHVWVWNSSHASALQKAVGGDRLAACWYSGGAFDIAVNLTDGQARKVSFYCLDWDNQSRTQRVEVLDSTGAVIHTTNLSNFQAGAYLSYDIKGSVTFRFTRTGPHNAVVSGLFFDAPSAPL